MTVRRFANLRRLLSLGVSGALVLLAPLYSQIEDRQTITKTGTTAAQFLKIGLDPRGSAMGNAYVAMRGDLGTLFWNPAGSAYIQGMETMFVTSRWLADIRYNYAAFTLQARGLGVLGLSITSLAVPEDLVRTVEKPEGTGELFDASDLALVISFSRRLTDKFSLGGNLKYIRQSIWHAHASAFAADLGALFVTPFKNIRLGASLSNYGSDMQLTGRDQKISVDPDPLNEGNVEFVNARYETDVFPLPLLFRVGIAGEMIQTSSLRLSLALDALHPNDNSESVNTGFELALGETVFLRGGYASLFRQDSEQGLTLGAGFHYRVWNSPTILKVDYSYAAYGRLNGVQRLAVGVKF